MKSSDTRTAGAYDPVCGRPVDPATADPLKALDNHTYFFCTDRCRSKFLANPHKYIDSAIRPEPPKSWWGRYLDRIQKATGGKPPKCCS